MKISFFKFGNKNPQLLKKLFESHDICLNGHLEGSNRPLLINAKRLALTSHKQNI